MKTVLSETETQLYDYISASSGITIKDIKTDFDAKMVGALGRLLKEELIEKIKTREGECYNVKINTYYRIKKETKEE